MAVWSHSRDLSSRIACTRRGIKAQTLFPYFSAQDPYNFYCYHPISINQPDRLITLNRTLPTMTPPRSLFNWLIFVLKNAYDQTLPPAPKFSADDMEDMSGKVVLV